jgi:CheY-like chemotaxis protein
MMADACSVLIIEDEPALRFLLATALTDEGFTVKAARDGRDGLAVLQHWIPKVILLDLHMPVMDGRAFRQAQRSHPKWANIPVIVLSAIADLPAQLQELDASAVLTKPCDFDVLSGTIRRVLENWPPGKGTPQE